MASEVNNHQQNQQNVLQQMPQFDLINNRDNINNNGNGLPIPQSLIVASNANNNDGDGNIDQDQAHNHNHNGPPSSNLAPERNNQLQRDMEIERSKWMARVRAYKMAHCTDKSIGMQWTAAIRRREWADIVSAYNNFNFGGERPIGDFMTAADCNINWPTFAADQEYWNARDAALGMVNNGSSGTNGSFGNGNGNGNGHGNGIGSGHGQSHGRNDRQQVC